LRTVKEIGRSYSTDVEISNESLDFSTTEISSLTSLTQEVGLYTYLVDATSGNINVNIPSAIDNSASFIIKKIDSSSNYVQLNGNISETIDGDAEIYLYDQYNFVQIQSDGTNWVIINEFRNEVWT
jgi:hypothetical protein